AESSQPVASGAQLLTLIASAVSFGRVTDRMATSMRRPRARIVGAESCCGRFDTHFISAMVVFAAAWGDAHPNRIRAIRAILIAIGSPTTRFRAVVQKYFLYPSADDSDPNPASRGACSRVARRIAPTPSGACRACKKSAIHKGFLHAGKIGDELARGAEVFAK